MTLLYFACVLALMVSVGHSALSQRMFLSPLAAEESSSGALSSAAAKRLTFAMFHLASICWLGMGASIFVMLQTNEFHRGTLFIYAMIYALSGFGNFWSLRRLHPGGIMLVATSGLILASILHWSPAS